MLELANISKAFPGVKALQDVSLTIKAGEVHALCGENGAGKTTLMNIITGNLQPDTGTIRLNGEPIQLKSVLHAQSLGIGIVYQEKSLVDALPVAENIFPVHPAKTKGNFIDHAAMHAQTRQLLAELEISGIKPTTVVGRLSPALKGMVEIAKALAQRPRLLILDEPTASITHEETRVLFSIIRRLKANGVAIVYISHRMAEIKEITDVVSVLKDGAYQGTVPASAPLEEMVRMMVGRELQEIAYASDARPDVRLRVQNLVGPEFHDISFDIREGEIVGFAGLLGSGRSALARTLFGDSQADGGTVLLDGKPYSPRHPSEAITNGVAYLPDERRTEGLFADMSVAANIISTGLDQRRYEEQEITESAKTLAEQLAIKTPSVKSIVSKLSGGNQQKVVIAKWLRRNPRLFIVNEPTHGVDIGAKAEIYSILKNITKQGGSVMMISSELPELLLLADRIAVMYNGKLVAILDKEEATEEKIAALASGIG